MSSGRLIVLEVSCGLKIQPDFYRLAIRMVLDITQAPEVLVQHGIAKLHQSAVVILITQSARPVWTPLDSRKWRVG
jgi:hypothetical protein